MKKNRYILASLLLFGGLIFAQSNTLKRANKLFDMKAYYEAAQVYEANEHTQEVLKNLGDSYYYNSNFEKASKTYRELYLKYGDSLNKDCDFRFAQALKGVGAYEEADKYLSRHYNKTFNTSDSLASIEKSTPHNFKLKEINTQNPIGDFGMSYFNDKVVFSSSRNTDASAYVWNNLPYLDLYTASIVNDTVLKEIVPLPKSINTKMHESSAVFTKDGMTMYFNRTGKKRKKTGQDKIAQVKLYRAEFIEGDWTNIEALPFTSDLYSTVHPTLSKDEKTLYFSSDMPGSLGGFDIYKVAINDDGTFGEPENLGHLINTENREQFPFISAYDVLYFSSDGQQGYGGLDVFRSNSINGDFDTPVNLGGTINSGLDDFSFAVLEKENKGNVSSNRTGSDRIFAFERVRNDLSKYLVEGVIQDKISDELLVGAKVELFDESGESIAEMVVGDDAYYMFKIEPNKKYKFRGTKKAYIPEDIEFSTDKEGKVQQNIKLALQAYTTAEERIQENKKGVVQVKLDKIYFNFSSAKINEGAANTLNVLVDLMKKYPYMEVEVSAHTDARGRAEFNLELSKMRASSTMEYLVSQGIERSRLSSVGYGEMQPLNNCVKENMCSESEYNVNRRCEFTILN
ncbi:OmpA family protein [Algibacter mikhailovii]|uniref:Cell envelope biogenesis protein OmpA n=1 Tax=Algibacter mikhailovii TaxID=425498 RepID=A0A918QZ87_9FLAO|nr:OmpA family protein [Algibacter mikhailovii]GGZ74194.1 cell envelope biogenesis protein OmpA [Algibacter mikhailovii]